MSFRELTIENWLYGQITTLEAKSIPRGVSSGGYNWLTKGDKIELRRGYTPLGNQLTGSGKITGLYVATFGDTKIPFRTRGKKLEYYDSTSDSWVEIGTDVLGSSADGKDISFAEYHSNSGDKVFVNSPYGPFLMLVYPNLSDYIDLYDSARNYKGYIQIKQNRMFLWGRIADKMGVYLSKIDTLNYTTVSSESIGTGDGTTKTFSGALAFKSGGSKRFCFAVEITDGTETFSDNRDGTLTGDKGGTGTINYSTGAYSVTFNTAPGSNVAITADYEWEDTTDGGIADFTKSSPRLAGEGAIFRQDEGGGDLMAIATYGADEYCFHKFKTWKLTLTSDDTNATNLIYRDKVGIPNWRAAVPTGEGIYFVDVSDEKDPQIRLLSLSPYSDQVVPRSVSKNFRYKNIRVGLDLSDYNFDDAVGFEWGDYILFACKTSDSSVNNRVIVYNRVKNTFDVVDYFVSVFANYNGTLIAGDPAQNNVYTLFSGFDDDDSLILGEWEGNEDDLNFDGLKKVKKLVFEGEVGPEQTIKVSASVDNGEYVEIGRIEGSGDYVDSGQPVSVGSLTIGSTEVGGGGTGATAYYYKREIDLGLDKFQRIKLKFEPLGLGYASISKVRFYDIRLKSRKIPLKYR